MLAALTSILYVRKRSKITQSCQTLMNPHQVMTNSHAHALHFKDRIAKFKEIWKTKIITRGLLKREKLDKSFIKYLKNVVMYKKIMHWSSVILEEGSGIIM